MKNLTPSLSTCKLLKEAGWKKETEFYWANYCGSRNAVVIDVDEFAGEDRDAWGKIAPAPLSDEFLGELPVGESPAKIELVKYQWKNKIYYRATYINNHWVADNPSEALSNLWLQLKKEKLL